MSESACVPELLRGVWQRRWIEYADGSRDDTSIVVWMQFESHMVDVRFAADHVELAARGSLDACDRDDLVRLASTDSSSGFTTCTPLAERNGVRTATAEWFSEPGIAVQPQTLFPEAGLLEWNEDGSVMIERAPSGAYVEEWHRVPETSGDVRRHRSTAPGYELFCIGPVVVEVIDRRRYLAPFAQKVPGTSSPPEGRLADMIRRCDDLVAARAVLDCEFSLAYEQHGEYAIMASTHPWRIGQTLTMDQF